MARMPSPENSWPAPRRSFSTSLTKDRSAIWKSSLPIRAVRHRRAASVSNVVLAYVAQHLVQRRDQRGVFGVVDAVEHGLATIMHRRPGAADLRAAGTGPKNAADAAVGLGLFAPDQPLRLQRVERAAHRRLLDD